ncbi:TetR/AcrR family transcriptional regulator [Bacillus songklensis]|uniref:TetR/AcrR family transcriptional regulator n=1 Tax=Bacillus songklensis TaxID=1069116 RepID=A0ABV8B2A1_9BACI
MNERWLEELLRINDEEIKLSEKQAKILEAAIGIFSQKGYAATSTSEIAKKAGVAEGTIFRHYKTKKDLLLAIVTPTLTKVVAPFLTKDFVKKVFENEYGSYEEFVYALMENRYEFVKKHLPIIKIFLQELAFHDEIKSQIQVIFTENVLEKFKRIVEHFQENGEIADVPSGTVIRMTMTTVIGFLLARFMIMTDADWDDHKEMNATIYLLMNGLAAK